MIGDKRKIISINTSHNSDIVIMDKGEIYSLEIDKLMGNKQDGLEKMGSNSSKIVWQEVLRHSLGLFHQHFNIDTSNFDLVVLTGLGLDRDYPGRNTKTLIELKNLLNYDGEIVWVDHHTAHASAAVYQSPFTEATVVSVDGWSHQGPTFAFTFRNGQFKQEKKFSTLSFGKAYSMIGAVSDLVTFRLPGKIMGLVAHGKVREEWKSRLTTIYRDLSHDGASMDWKTQLEILAEIVGSKLCYDETALFPNYVERVSGSKGIDLCTTSQKVLEEVWFELFEDLIKRNGLPICLSGGVHLNVILNQKIRAYFDYPVFVPPNPNDSGLGFGALLYITKTYTDNPYLGFPLLDKHNLIRKLRTDVTSKVIASEVNYRWEHSSISSIIALLKQGKSIGIARGRAEIGPRALGNRSILVDPSIPGILDKINKMKYREWYRPIAPVVLLEDADEYFEGVGPSRFMSFNPSVRPKWEDRLSGIVHVDGTARIQTVSKDQNPWLHELLTAWKEASGYSVLINTSLNTRGAPIANTVEEVFDCFLTTELDNILIEDYIFYKEPKKKMKDKELMPY